MFYSARYRNAFMALTLLLFVISGCGDDSSNSASLDGDLSFEVTGDAGTSFVMSRTQVTGDGANFSTIGTVVSPDEGDLEDGDFDGYVLQASPIGGGEPDITLMLRSDGDVVKETSSITDNGVFRIEVGDVPDLSDLQ